MSKTKPHRLGDLQLRILKVLWERREATVADVLAAVSDHSELAYTTIATMLRKMEARGLVAHRTDGRVFIYTAKVAAEDISHGMTSQLVDRLFQGSLLEVVNHLLTSREVSREELRQLEQLIAERKKQL